MDKVYTEGRKWRSSSRNTYIQRQKEDIVTLFHTQFSVPKQNKKKKKEKEIKGGGGGGRKRS